MVKCDDSCHPICDFCAHFLSGIQIRGRDIENGFCIKHKRRQDILRMCDDFHCFASLSFVETIKRKCRDRRISKRYNGHPGRGYFAQILFWLKRRWE
jgi:hypothetical protein